MGGEKETVISQSTPANKIGKSRTGKIGKRLRIHENQGEVHFHDDEKNTKVAIPVAVWSNAWEKYSTELGNWSYLDQKERAVLLLSVFRKKKKIKIDISVENIITGDAFNELQKFTVG